MCLVASVVLSVQPITAETFDLGALLCRVQQRRIITLNFETKMKRTMKSHFQCEVYVYVSTNRADAVNRLLINYIVISNSKNLSLVSLWSPCKYYRHFYNRA